MKTKSLLFGALATALLASCSDDRVTGMSSIANGGEITYSAVANKATRATDLYNNGNLPTSFYVWAALEGTPASVYISGDEVKDDGTGVYTDVNGTHYWPSEALNFYASNYSTVTLVTTTDETASPATTVTTATIADYTVASTAATQEDLLYAVELGQTKGTTGVVALNFRHALSQIVFTAENDDANLYVEITGVGVNNVAGTGTFTFPTGATTTNVPYSYSDYPEDGSVGTWGGYSDAAGTTSGYYTDAYSIALDTTVSLAASATAIASAPLTSGETALLLLPQTANATTGVKTGEIDGAYITLQCAIYNVAGTTYDPSTDYQIFGTDDASATVYFPVAIDWAPGMKYTYNFVFGGTSSGGDGYGEDENDQPILVPITYTVTADEFVEADAINEEAIASSSKYVDLGLPSGLKWATCNVGADVPADYGDYFAWGEITPAADGNYSSSNCRLYGLPEYNGMEVTEENITGNPDFDAARANWGDTWRMPTKAEFEELFRCEHTQANLKNSKGEEVSGMLVTGTNGNSIFLPFAGYYNGTTPHDATTSGYYRTTTPDESSLTKAYRLFIQKSAFSLSTASCYYGLSVRPVSE